MANEECSLSSQFTVASFIKLKWAVRPTEESFLEKKNAADDGKHPREATRSLKFLHLMTYLQLFSLFLLNTCLLWTVAKGFQRRVTLLLHSQYLGIRYSVYLDNSQDVNSINLSGFLSPPNWLEINLSWIDHFSSKYVRNITL